MSRSADQRDRGFTLIEVMVALGIILILLAAITPAIVLGLRSNALATSNTQARGIAQAELERMRNLPFHIARNAGEYVDVLDHYFPDLTAATTPGSVPACRTGGRWTLPATGWKGYVDGTTARCGWEPADGPFYRHVRETADFVVVVDTQFVDNRTPAEHVTPPAGYRNVGTVPVGADAPPSSQILARVTVFTRNGRAQEPVSSSTQITRTDVTVTRVASSVDVTALEVGTTTTSGLPVNLTIGSVDLGGEVTTSSEARASLTAALTGLGTGQQAGGAAVNIQAPVDGTVASTSPSGGFLDPPQTCFLACWGGTSSSAVTVSTANGLPNVASPAAPATVTVDDLSNAGFALGQGLATVYRPELDLRQRLVRVDTGPPVQSGISTSCVGNTSGGSVRARAGGWLRTTAPGATPDTHVGACGAARTAPISVLPTNFAQDGVLRVYLEAGRAYCTVDGAAHNAAATYGYHAVVERWTPDGYRVLARVQHGGTAVPLEAGASDTLNGLDPASFSLGGTRTLADYISSWSSIRSTDIAPKASGGVASVSIPGVVRLVSQPLRESTPTEDDPLSTLSLTLGTFSCHAEDRR